MNGWMDLLWPQAAVRAAACVQDLSPGPPLRLQAALRRNSVQVGAVL